MDEIAEIEKDSAKYLEKQRKFFGVKVTFVGSDKKRYQLEIPDSQVKKVDSSYELQSQRKGFRRYYNEYTRVIFNVYFNFLLN